LIWSRHDQAGLTPHALDPAGTENPASLGARERVWHVQAVPLSGAEWRRMTREITTVGIVGAGQMGNGIAHVAALSGFEVILTDIDHDSLDRAQKTIAANLDRQVRRGTIAASERDEASQRIRVSSHLREHRAAQLVIESAVESFGIKAEIFRQLDSLCDPEVVLASNTSSISITRLASVTRRPSLFVGMHFMNPVPMMKLVEIIRGFETSDDTYSLACDISARMGKTPVTCNDYPGFVSNRVLMPMINEAVFAVHEQVATVEAVDEIMKLGMNHPMGPLELADLIGLDTCLSVMRILQEELGDPKYRPCPLMVKMVEAGRLGRKTGRGFYSYPRS
jgi:3-hydroxybutyryl-CoA dehydrogenase